MTTFVDLLKSEIARVARKELKPDVRALRKAVGTHRSEIAALKKQLKLLASQVKALQRHAKSGDVDTAMSAEPVRRSRTSFGPAALTDLRARLGITKGQLARLLGASSVSVRKWEAGAVQPRAAQLLKIANVVKLGKRSAMAQLGD